MIGPRPLPLILILTTFVPFWPGLCSTHFYSFDLHLVGEPLLLFPVSEEDTEAGRAQISGWTMGAAGREVSHFRARRAMGQGQNRLQG